MSDPHPRSLSNSGPSSAHTAAPTVAMRRSSGGVRLTASGLAALKGGSSGGGGGRRGRRSGPKRRTSTARRGASGAVVAATISAHSSGRGVADSKKSSDKKKKRKTSAPATAPFSWVPYICKARKDIHPTMTLSKESKEVLESMMRDVFERIMSEARTLMVNAKNKKTLTHEDIAAACRLLFGGQLHECADKQARKALARMKASKRQPLKQQQHGAEFAGGDGADEDPDG